MKVEKATQRVRKQRTKNDNAELSRRPPKTGLGLKSKNKDTVSRLQNFLHFGLIVNGNSAGEGLDFSGHCV